MFTLPDTHHERIRTPNCIEQLIWQELKRRASKRRTFPNLDALERSSTAALVEIDEKWETANKAYIEWEMLNE